jgi:hypothetical protein
MQATEPRISRTPMPCRVVNINPPVSEQAAIWNQPNRAQGSKTPNYLSVERVVGQFRAHVLFIIVAETLRLRRLGLRQLRPHAPPCSARAVSHAPCLARPISIAKSRTNGTAPREVGLHTAWSDKHLAYQIRIFLMSCRHGTKGGGTYGAAG